MTASATLARETPLRVKRWQALSSRLISETRRERGSPAAIAAVGPARVDGLLRMASGASATPRSRGLEYRQPLEREGLRLSGQFLKSLLHGGQRLAMFDEPWVSTIAQTNLAQVAAA